MEAKEREPGARVGSLVAYRSRADHVRAFGPDTTRSLHPEDLTRFTADLLAEGYAPATVQAIGLEPRRASAPGRPVGAVSAPDRRGEPPTLRGVEAVKACP